MTFSNTVLATASLVAFATPSRAFEPLTFGDFSLLLGGGVNLTATHDAETTSNAYGDLESTLAFKYDFGPLTFGIEAYSELEFDSDAEGRNLAVYDDPYVDLGLWIEGESFGYLSYSYESSAIGENCVEAPSTGDNFGHADFVTNGTCPSFDTRSVLYYKSPVFAGGFSLAASYMPATSFDDVDLGEASESASVALGYTGETADGATWTGSFGFEKVLAVNGGGAKATAWQLGINRAKDGWTIGAAAAVTDNGDGTEERAFGLAVLRVVSEKLTLSGGLNLSHSGIGGADLSETSLSLIGLYQIAPDTAMLEAGIWQIRTDDAGARSQRTVVGLGVSLYF